MLGGRLRTLPLAPPAGCGLVSNPVLPAFTAVVDSGRAVPPTWGGEGAWAAPSGPGLGAADGAGAGPTPADRTRADGGARESITLCSRRTGSTASKSMESETTAWAVALAGRSMPAM